MAKKEVKESNTLSSRLDALKALQAQINKAHGDGAIMIGDNDRVKGLEFIPTGSAQLDKALSIGGLPKGRIVEIFGLESGGKSTLAMSVVAQAQKNGGVVAYVDAEHALDPNYAKQLGIDLGSMMISQPDCAEQALDIVEKIVQSKTIDVVVVDSVAALVPKAELEGEFGQSNVGLHARLMSQAMRKLTATISNTNTLVIFINQIRMKIGVMYGNPETTTGGNALKFYSSVRLEVRKGEILKNGDNVIGHLMKIKVVKNKVGAPLKVVEVPLIYGKGFDRVFEVYQLAKEAGVLDVRGAHHYFNGNKLAASASEMKTLLETDPALLSNLEAALVTHIPELKGDNCADTE